MALRASYAGGRPGTSESVNELLTIIPYGDIRMKCTFIITCILLSNRATNRINTKRTVITSSADCYFTPDLDFTVDLVDSSQWRVTSVRALPPRY